MSSQALIGFVITFGLVIGQQPLIWPLPAEYTTDETTSVNISYNFAFNANINSDILKSGIERYTQLSFPHIPTIESPSNGINSMTISVASTSDELQYDTDESYNLTLTNNQIILVANTIYGALRGLETFSQTIVYNFDAGLYESYPYSINDYPRFKWRGILLDCSRHFHSVSALYRLLDAMSYAKLNAFHWHLTDDQSIPYQSMEYPKFDNASYTKYERYSPNDMKAVVQYAKYRGIRVIPEFDVPGHATSWCKGYPEVCPYNGTNSSCNYPLNPATNVTFELIDGLIAESYDNNNIFFDKYVHMGGDEVNTYCWSNDPTIIEWMNQNGFNVVTANQYFMQRVHNISSAHGLITIQWDDVYGMDIYKDTIIEAYYFQNITTIVKAGYKSILSNENAWYLDHLGTTWDIMYNNEPCAGLTTQECVSSVLGGEMSMWSESVDDSDLDNTIWPRAAGGSEKLWSQESQTTNNINNAHPRIEYFRCLLNSRNIGAAPTNNAQARQPPGGPSSCYHQRRRLINNIYK